MFNNQKIIYGFNDLCVLPNIQNNDRQVVPSLDNFRQKNGRSRYLITVFNQRDLKFAKDHKDYTYIAKFGDVGDRVALLLDTDCLHIIPEFTIVEFIKERAFIESALAENKDKFNIVLNMCDMTPLLLQLRSSDLSHYLSLFNIVYRVYPCQEILSMLNDMRAYGIIIDSSMNEVELKANASVIAFASSYIMGMFPDRRFRDSDLFEKSKYGNYATISIHNDMDKYGIKSFALGAQFVLIESTTFSPCDTVIHIEEMESRVLKFMAFLNSSRFPDIYQNSECCLMSRY